MTAHYGQPLVFPNYRGRIWPSYNYPLILEAISDCQQLLESPSCRIIHKGRNRLGMVVLPSKEEGQLEVVIKEFRPQGIDRWKSLFLPSKAAKAWRGACLLLIHDINTPLPVAYLEQRRSPLVKSCYYLCRRVPEVEEIRFLFGKLSSSELKTLLSYLAGFLVDCHQKGILHGDLSDGNILVRKHNNNEYEFFLIDTNRIKFKKYLPSWLKLKNLVRLGVPPSFQRFFLEQYLGRSSLTSGRWRWYRFSKQCFSGYIRLKKRLGLRPLARKLKIQ